ncbi:MAG: hypothetical protein H6707_03580 [Deltaproteobacteria bacterium]|nr:hypothetical protein [Deltaproteobacteria bacterium]
MKRRWRSVLLVTVILAGCGSQARPAVFDGGGDGAIDDAALSATDAALSIADAALPVADAAGAGDGARPADGAKVSDGSSHDGRPACQNECPQQGARRCEANGGYAVCGNYDGDACLEWSQASSCPQEQICVEPGGVCTPACNGKPCACQIGDTQPCVNVGECKDGIRQCVNGSFGPCIWKTGPQSEVCDGKDNDCDGATDESTDLAAPACSKQLGVCSGATKKCGGAAGWLTCVDADYKAQAKLAGQSYEVVESLCDAQDNDCNGKTDEPAQCCKPQCASKPCGAQDGCGSQCNGFCGLHQTCDLSFNCVCANVTCNGVCCGTNEVCSNNTCTPGAVAGWKLVSSGTTQRLDAIWAAGPNDVWFAGTGGTLLHYDGSSVKAFNSGTTADLVDLWGFGSSSIVAIGGYNPGVITTYDGTKWNAVSSSLIEPRAIWGRSASDYYVSSRKTVGKLGDDIYHFVGGALAGSVFSPGYWVHELSGSAKTGEIWGPLNRSAVYFDGSSWTILPSVFPDTLGAVWMRDSADVWAGGRNTLVRYDGSKWSPYSQPHANTHYLAIHGTAADDVWAVGTSGKIAHFDGNGWQLSTQSHTSQDLRDVFAISASDVWAVSHQGVILHYTP